ncbi:MAG: HD domain-containing protein [Chloroflexota bacterium]
MAKKKIKWKPAVQYQAKKAAQAEARYTSGTKSYSFNYRWEHVKTVVKLARVLVKECKGDTEIVEAAAWLHDAKKEYGKKHPIEGARFAKAFLPTTDFPSKKIGAVCHAIEVHSGLWRDTPLKNLEAQILWDADKLSKIGLTAAFHWIGGALNREDRSFTSDELVKFLRRSDLMYKTAASFHTEAARKVAQERIAAFEQFWRTLDIELTGKDLRKWGKIHEEAAARG